MKTMFARQISLFFIVLLCYSCSQEFNFSQNNVFGEYCAAKNLNKNGDIWLLKKYKENKPYLFSYIPCSYYGNYSGFFFDKKSNYEMLYGGVLQNSVYDETTPSECSKNKFNREYFFANEIYRSTQSEMSKIIDLENKYHNLNWKISYDSNYVRLHHSGSTKVYISGFCTEEQLEIIRKREKDK